MKKYQTPNKKFSFWAKTKPYFHQKLAVEKTLTFLNEKGGYCLFSEAGTGKTKIIIDAIRYRLMEDKNRYYFIVVPKTLLPSWQREIEKHSKINPSIQFLYEGSSQDKFISILTHIQEGHISIMNYEPFTRVFFNPDNVKALMAMFEAAGKYLDTIIVDESSRCRDPKTKFWRTLWTFRAEHDVKVILLNGTPIEQGLEQIWPQFRVTYKDDPFNCWSYGIFINKYFKHYYGGRLKLWEHMRDDYQKVLEEYSFRITLDAIRDMPERVFNEYDLPLIKEVAKIYDKLLGEFYVRIQGKEYSASVMVAIVEKLLQACTGVINMAKTGQPPNYVFVKEQEEKRYQLVLDIINQSAGQVVVFFRHRINGTRLHNFLVNNGIDAKEISMLMGGLDDATKEDAWVGLNEGKYKVGLFQIGSGGQGINLPNVKHMIFLELWWSARLYQQALGRTRRLDSDNRRIHINIIYAPGTVEEIMMKRITGKIKDANEFLEAIEESVFGEHKEHLMLRREVKQLMADISLFMEGIE